MVTRTVLLRYDDSHSSELPAVNMNDDVELLPYHSYTLIQHMQDLASDGLIAVSRVGMTVDFENGESYRYEERVVPVDLSLCDEETATLLLQHDALYASK